MGDEKNDWDVNSDPLDTETKGGVGEMVKKVLAVGIGAAFLTEESIRNSLKEIKLPKEILNALVQGASKSKEEITNRVSNEIIKIISKIDFVKEASRFVEDHKFRVSAEIEVLKKNGSSQTAELKIDVKNK